MYLHVTDMPQSPFSPALHILFSLDCTTKISGDNTMGVGLHQGTVLALGSNLT